MAIYQLRSSDKTFPSPENADYDGLLAYGGDLSAERLLQAYNQGIFPWYSSNEPILWWSPNPRMVLFPGEVKVSKSMRKVLRDATLTVTYNTAFTEVILNCRRMKRTGQSGTWITDEMLEAYIELHEKGFAQSVEVWQDDELVGGLYGVDLEDKKVFCGESMFAKVSNASKIALISLSRKLEKKGYHLIDCQVHTNHLQSMGAREIPRSEFLNYLS
ncbi:MAG: leucyl/phenylalanyl-tRNA--protein transferase [Cytophagaceae bacterium]|nr:leucyl/phenylalanyl-tRNA--protein transferase [Cytophagaceae bacterium]|tara:strand:- start:2454 stop:3101 length:648 start_codon:yes stop_codon:yes gene_type:complete